MNAFWTWLDVHPWMVSIVFAPVLWVILVLIGTLRDAYGPKGNPTAPSTELKEEP